MVLNRGEVPLRAVQRMKPQRGLKALADAVSRALLAWMQGAPLGVLPKVLVKHILQGRSHGTVIFYDLDLPTMTGIGIGGIAICLGGYRGLAPGTESLQTQSDRRATVP